MRRKWAFLCVVVGIAIPSALAADPPTDPFACSATRPCKIGCCGKSNICGLGPDFCSPENCTSSCDQKSDCDPGWGAQWSTNEKCPLNVCCSKFGFCGTTPEFCGTTQVTSPSCGGSSSTNRVVGYYEGWSTTRACDGMFPENIPFSAYTHLNYAFAFVDPNSFAVAPMSDTDKDLYSRFTGLKEVNPGLQTWISIGGWSMNDPDQPTHSTFSDLAGSSDAQSRFFSSLLQFMTTYGFDGVDIDWEYPVAPERSGKTQDFSNYVSFLKNLRNALGSGGHNYGLSITIPSSFWYMQHFDIVAIESVIDWFNVMTYDLHGTWDSTDPFIGPVINAHTNLTEINQTLNLLWRNNIDPKKVTLGLGFYGRSFTLADPTCTQAGCPFSAGGNPGECTASSGTLSFAEIQRVINTGATVSLDSAAAVKIVVFDNNQWVSYDDEETLKMKIDYANSKCLGGLMVWAASTDDQQGTAAHALGNVTGRDGTSFAQLAAVQSSIGQCVWGECGQNCPPGLSAAQRSDGKNRGNAGIYNGCNNGETRNYCCPANDVPTCTWRGTAPFCGGRCHDGEVEVTSSTSATGKSCWTGHKVLCCLSTPSDANIGACHWEGSAPICSITALLGPAGYYSSASCPKDHPDKLTTGKYGAGGEQPCKSNGGFKSFCCMDPIAWQNCAWYQLRGSWKDWANAFLSPFSTNYNCQGECPAGKVPIATDSYGCMYGTASYFCCDDPAAMPPPSADDNLCAVSDSLYLESGQQDDSGDSDFLLEVFQFEEDCFISGEANSGDPSGPNGGFETRSLHFNSNDSSVDSFTEWNEWHVFERRAGSSRLQKICGNGPGPIRNRLTNSLRSRPYPSVKELSARLPFIGWAKPIGCALAGLAASATGIPGTMYVTEHVFELQSVKSFIQSMIDGVLPGGGLLSTGKVSFSFFGIGGEFQSAWASLGITAPPVGTTPEQTIYSALGTTSSFDNFQIFAAKLNGLKAIIWAGSKNIIGDANYNHMNHLERIKALSDIINVFDYLNLPTVQTSLTSAYNGMKAGWQIFEQAVPGYDFVEAFKEWNTAQFSQMVSVASNFLTTKLPAELAYWQSSQAVEDYGIRVVASQVRNLQVLQAAIAQKIVMDTKFIK